MDRKPARITGMKPFVRTVITLTCLFCGASSSVADGATDALIQEFTGQQPPQARSIPQWISDYSTALNELVPAMAADDLAAREAPQQTVEQMCFWASTPGREIQRRTLCDAIAGFLGPHTPKPARVWLLRQVERIGDRESVPPVAALFTDEDAQIRELARRALQHNPSETAGAVLREALSAAQDPAWQVALINALAARGDKDSLGYFTRFARHENPALAAAGIAALGDVGGKVTVAVLTDLRRDEDETRHHDATIALLRVADRLIDTDQSDTAEDICLELYVSSVPADIRLGALRGLVRLRKSAAFDVLLEIITDETGPDALRLPAADLLAEISNSIIVARIARMFPEVSPAAQALLLRALAGQSRVQGRHVGAAIAEAALSSRHAKVRIAAAEALEVLGDHLAVPLLLEVAGKDEAAQSAARRTLARLRGAAADDALLTGLDEAPPAERVERIRALSARYCHKAVPALLAEARQQDESVVQAALDALGVVATAADAPALVKLLTETKLPVVRDAAVDATVAACNRIAAPEARAEPLLAVWGSSQEAAQVSLLHALGRVGGTAALAKIRAARKTDDADIADAAIRALARWPDPEVLDDLLQIVGHSSSKTHRVLALRGFIRLLEKPSEHTPEAIIDLYRTALKIAERPDERRMALAGLGTVPHRDALNLAQTYLDQPELQAEAEAAVIQAARLLAPTDNASARAAIEAILAQTTHDANREAAQAALESIRDLAGNIVQWQVAGPYFKDDLDADGVFQHAFAPESPDATDVDWQPLPPTNEDHPWIFDLTKLDSGSTRCLYVRTQVWSEEPQDARLDIGSDDGIKVWLNATLVHENNVARGHDAFEDQAPVTLQAGWNLLLLKINQIGGGWMFSARLRTSEGNPLDGLKFRAE